MTIFGIGMIALGALVVVLAWRRHTAKVAECEQAARTWQSVDGTLLEVSIRERIDRDSEGDETISHVPKVAYGYRVAAREYEGSRSWLARDAFSNKREADAWAAARPAGSTAKVWYDPADPAQSTLEIDRPSVVNFAVFALIGLIFAGVGAIFLLF